MTCSEIQRLISVHPEDRTLEENSQISEHLDMCESCEAEAMAFNRTDMLIREALSSPGEVSSRERDDLLFDPPTDPNASATSKRNSGWLVSVAALLLISTGVTGYMLGVSKEKINSQQWIIDQQGKTIGTLEASMHEQKARIVKLEENPPLTSAPRTVVYHLFGQPERERPKKGLLLFEGLR